MCPHTLSTQAGLHHCLEHRAIGVVYNPRYELGNYVTSVIPKRYDAFLYIDETHALKPLHMKPKKEEVLETYADKGGENLDNHTF